MNSESFAWCKDVVALTGTIGSGKSAVRCMLEECGATVFDADQFSRDIVARGSDGLAAVAAAFGMKVLTHDGSLDRAYVADLIFSDVREKERYLAIVTPLIWQRAAEAIATALNDRKSELVLEAPTLFEAGAAELGWKKIVVITTGEEIAVRRLISGRGFTDADARRRIAQQFPAAVKAQRADIVVDNSGTLDELRERVHALYSELFDKH